MDVSRLPLQALSTKVSGYRSKGRPRKDGSIASEMLCTQQDGVMQMAVEKARDRQRLESSFSPIVGNLQVYDGQDGTQAH